MYVAIILIHVLLAISLIALVLLQRGKGAEAGAAFGGGASQTVLGSQGASKTLARLTAVLAGLFFITSLGLAWLVNSGSGDSQSGIPDARVIEQQRSGAPSLDDGDDAPRAPNAQQGSDSGNEGLSVPSTDNSSNN
ncbi:preprotein translocase subunit SecG [Kushneria sp. TE3]|uniref:preprotein translocase subunit SecG n=1 Tax=Kushneria sp. TE3 TaxID=3449832 RepID=UPI003F686DAA